MGLLSIYEGGNGSFLPLLLVCFINERGNGSFLPLLLVCFIYVGNLSKLVSNNLSNYYFQFYIVNRLLSIDDVMLS